LCLAFLLSPATRRHASLRCRRATGDRRGSAERARPNDTYYLVLYAGGLWLTLGTFDTPELASRAFDAAA
jgi:hypothetical protein